MATLMETCPSCHPRSLLMFQNMLCIASSAVCVVYAFSDPVHPSSRAMADIYVTAGNGEAEGTTFSVVNPVYLLGISQSIALAYSILDLFGNGSVFYKRTHDEVFKLSMTRTALSSIALHMGLLLLVPNEATFVPFLASIAMPLVLAMIYAATTRTKVPATNWLLLHACILVEGLFQCAFYLNTFYFMITGISRVRQYARVFVSIGVTSRFVLMWTNVMVRAVWVQGTRLTTTTYIHTTIDEATRFLVVFCSLAYADDHKDYLIVGTAVALAYLLFPASLIFNRTETTM